MILASIHDYLEKYTPERLPVLREMELYAKERRFPIIGPLVGRLLFQMVLATRARRILELGSGFGYSAFWFSMATKSKGHIIMTDTDRKNKTRAFGYFKKAGLQSQFDFRIGDAKKIVKKIDGPFDIVLNDIDKKDYPDTIDLIAPKLKKGGLFITDNVIWSGRVIEKNPDATSCGIIEFTEKLYRDSRFYTTIVPLRDGLSIAVKL